MKKLFSFIFLLIFAFSSKEQYYKNVIVSNNGIFNNGALFNLDITYSTGGIGMPQACLITYTRLPKADFEQSLKVPSGDATIMQINDDL